MAGSCMAGSCTAGSCTAGSCTAAAAPCTITSVILPSSSSFITFIFLGLPRAFLGASGSLILASGSLILASGSLILASRSLILASGSLILATLFVRIGFVGSSKNSSKSNIFTCLFRKSVSFFSILSGSLPISCIADSVILLNSARTG